MPDQNRDTAREGTLAAVVEMQKRIVLMLDGVQNRSAETTQAVERVARRLTKLHEEQVTLTSEVGQVRQELGQARQDLTLFRKEMVGRFEAVGERFDEVEHAVDGLRRELRDARTEIVSQNLETLNAVQEALNVRAALNDLSDTVEELRSRLP